MSYAYLFKYIIIGDTGQFNTLRIYTPTYCVIWKRILRRFYDQNQRGFG